MIEEGNIAAVFSKPITAVLMLVSIVSLLWPVIKPMFKRNRGNATN
mgnify:FL=1